MQETDVRVLAATHRNLEAEVAAGRFREDLYYRIEEFTLHVPPLRERTEDIPGLVEHFARLHGDGSLTAASLPAGALAMFSAHRWPGNVRELRNVVRRMLVLPDLSAHRHVGSPAAPLAASAHGQLWGAATRVREWLAADEDAIRRRSNRERKSASSSDHARPGPNTSQTTDRDRSRNAPMAAFPDFDRGVDERGNFHVHVHVHVHVHDRDLHPKLALVLSLDPG